MHVKNKTKQHYPCFILTSQCQNLSYPIPPVLITSPCPNGFHQCLIVVSIRVCISPCLSPSLCQVIYVVQCFLMFCGIATCSLRVFFFVLFLFFPSCPAIIYLCLMLLDVCWFRVVLWLFFISSVSLISQCLLPAFLSVCFCGYLTVLETLYLSAGQQMPRAGSHLSESQGEAVGPKGPTM